MKGVLLSGVSMVPTPAERQMGRFMRAPDGHDDTGTGGGAPESGQNGNNSNVNLGESNNGGSGGDNAGGGDDLASFWNDPPADGSGNEESGEQDQQQSQALGQELAGLISGHQAAPLFTKELADQIADGNLEGINKAFGEAQQAALRQSLVLNTKLISAVANRLESQMQARIDAALGNKDSEVALETHFPAAKDPKARPLIQRVWDQSMKQTKGDKQKAVQLTRQMLDAFGQSTGLSTPPSDPSTPVSSDASRSLVDDLLGRGG